MPTLSIGVKVEEREGEKMLSVVDPNFCQLCFFPTNLKKKSHSRYPLVFN